MRNLIQKPWGWTEQVSDHPMFHMHRIDVRAGMACSWHHHRFKWNGFLCSRGILIIDYVEGVTSDAPEKYQTVFLSPTESFDVPPQWTHRMRAHHSGTACAHEYYWTSGVASIGGRVRYVDPEDIVRVSKSGVRVP